MSDKRSGKSPEIPQTTRIVVLIPMYVDCDAGIYLCSGDDRNGVAILGHGGGELYDLQQGLYGRVRHQGRLCRGGS